MMAGNFSKPVSLLYWIGAANIVWISLEVCARAAAWPLPKGKTPLFVILLLSGLLQPIVGRPLLSLWQTLFLGFLPAGAEQPVLAYVFTSVSDYARIIMANTFIIGVWVAFNFLFDRLLRFPRFRAQTGYSPDSSEGREISDRLSTLVPSGFLLRLPQALGKDVIALSAEDHYVRVYTKLGNDLVLYRFSDAIREMPDDMGMQVHRSHWVSLNAISKFEEEGRGHKLTVGENVQIPVSQRYIEVLKGRGITPG